MKGGREWRSTIRGGDRPLLGWLTASGSNCTTHLVAVFSTPGPGESLHISLLALLRLTGCLVLSVTRQNTSRLETHLSPTAPPSDRAGNYYCKKCKDDAQIESQPTSFSFFNSKITVPPLAFGGVCTTRSREEKTPLVGLMSKVLIGIRTSDGIDEKKQKKTKKNSGKLKTTWSRTK